MVLIMVLNLYYAAVKGILKSFDFLKLVCSRVQNNQLLESAPTFSPPDLGSFSVRRGLLSPLHGACQCLLHHSQQVTAGL